MSTSSVGASSALLAHYYSALRGMALHGRAGLNAQGQSLQRNCSVCAQHVLAIHALAE
nr:hypothetical protein [uncultured Pseudomonas sp.]